MMNRVADYLFVIAITLWVGALWAIGYIAAPVLFSTLQDRMLAGTAAGRMFTIVSWLGIVCATYILIYLFVIEGLKAFKSVTFWFVLVMLILTMVGQFWITPIIESLKAQSLPHDIMQSILRDRFAMWHGISSVLYLIQSILGIALVTQAVKR